MNRRLFLKSGGLALAGVGLSGVLPGVLQQVARAAAGATRPKVLVVLFQRGAVDGLSLLVPHAEPAYYAARPTLAIARPGREDGALDLDGTFGLHPALAPLRPFWRAGRMAAVHAAGSPDNTRSHFDAQAYMETATPGHRATPDGWLNRLLRSRPRASVFSGVAMTAQMPRSLAGPAPAVALTDLSRFALQAGTYEAAVDGGFEQLWRARADALGDAGRETLDAVRLLRDSGAAQRLPEHGAQYPAGTLGDSLRSLAQLIKADVGVQVGFAECGGWDTHVNQGAARGGLAARLDEFARAIAAFLTDLGPLRDDVLLLTQSEFGRTVRENGTRGTDHGHGNVMLAFGGQVRGGRVLGEWPGLSDAQLYEGRDLAVTTDFRTVLAEIAMRHLGVDAQRGLFPGFDVDPKQFVGLLG